MDNTTALFSKHKERLEVTGTRVGSEDFPPGAIAAGAHARTRRFNSHLPRERRAVLAREYEDALGPQVAADYL